MEQDSNKDLSLAFDSKREGLLQTISSKDINAYIYILGITIGSRHLSQKKLEIIGNNASNYKSLWDVNVWMRTIWGTDDYKTNMESSNDFDKAMETTKYFDYLISQAIKYNRPDWSIFGLIGMMQGTLNENNFEINIPENKLDRNDFIRCLKYLSFDFLEKFGSDLEYLFSYFDERGYKLIVQKVDQGMSISIEDSVED